MDQTVSNSGFVGDMSYPGDGGDTLQRLYELCHWSEIPNCPGRYVTKRNTVAEAMSPINLLHLLGTTDQIYEYDNIGNGVRGKDRVAIAQFRDGGGLITYIKPDSRFIHTLNTKSGFNRKLMSLGLAHQSVGVVNT
jgi:hypothetical protein